MKLGAQLYSVRNWLKTPEDAAETFRKIKEIGYENVQLSGHAQMDPYVIRGISEQSGLSIVCTHSPWDRIVNDTEKLIEEHKIFGCPVIGLGMMPKEYQTNYEDAKKFVAAVDPAVKKILDAGLSFAYHNHALEFNLKTPDGAPFYDELIAEKSDWNLIMDTYWVAFAGYDPIEYIRKIGAKRLPNIHFKDMANDEKHSICACGNGTLDFAKIAAVCAEVGVKNVLVEQDNAPEAPDAFAEMATSFRHLRPIIH